MIQDFIVNGMKYNIDYNSLINKPEIPKWAQEEAPDKSLEREGEAADAKETGDRFDGIKQDLNNLDDTLKTVVITKKPINMLNPSDFISGGYWSNYGKWSETSDYKYSENFLNFKGHTLRAYTWNGSNYVPVTSNFFFCAVYVNGSVPYPPIAEISEAGSAITIPNNENITKIIISVKNSVQLITVDIATPPTEYTEYTAETTHELNQETFKHFIDMKTGFDSVFAKVIRKSRNVYDANTWTVGKIINVDGTTDTDVDFLTSPKIEITNGQSLIGYGYRNGSLCELGCLYTILDADNNPLLSVIPPTSPVINIKSMPTAKYIILSAASFYARMVLLGDIVANTDDDGAVVFETCDDVEEYTTVAKYNKKPLIVANGDSITYGSRTSTELYPNMIQGISYIDYVAHDIGADLLKFAIPSSSCGLWTDGVDHLNALCLRYTEMPDNADLVYIAIGSNDWAAQSIAIGQIGDTQNTTFYGALNTLCKGLMEKYPTTPILFATPIKRWEEKNTNPMLNPNGEDIFLYCDAIKEVCGYYGIPVFDANKETWINPWIESERNKYVPDGIHPNELGHRKMANSCRGFIQKYLIS